VPLLRHALRACRRRAQGRRALTPRAGHLRLPSPNIGHATSRADSLPAARPTLLVAPSWVGDAILTEPLLARLRARDESSRIDVLAPEWCAPVYARMRGVGEVFDSTMKHGEINFAERRALARTLSAQGYRQAIVLPNSWKSALVPWLARIPRRTGYVGEMRWGILNDGRRLDRARLPRLVDRYAALAEAPREPIPAAGAPVLVPDAANRDAAVRALGLRLEHPVAILCPGAEFGPAKRWPAEHFANLARALHADGLQVWLLGSPNDKAATAAVLAAAGATGGTIRDLSGRTDLGTAIDLLSLAAVAVCNDSGLMHAAAAVGVPLVALFGSTPPAYTPPMSAAAAIARIEIACSPCFKRECPLGHFKCMRDLAPDAVYDLARAQLQLRAAGGASPPAA
jgi:heptosyltransferase-2